MCVETCDLTEGEEEALSSWITLHQHVASRSKDPQDVRAGASGGEEWEVVHREGRGGSERPEPREQALRGAVGRGPQLVSVTRGRHHRGGAAQHQERPFLPHNHRQVRGGFCGLYAPCFYSSPHLVWCLIYVVLRRRPANPDSPCLSTLHPHPVPHESPPHPPQITPSVSVSASHCRCMNILNGWDALTVRAQPIYQLTDRNKQIWAFHRNICI